MLCTEVSSVSGSDEVVELVVLELVDDVELVDEVDDVPLVPDESDSVTGGGTNATARTSVENRRRRARASCERSISSRPLAVSLHD
jgi:hypothetical protein